MEIGKQIKQYRKKLRMSQEGLAEKIYVTRQSISNWENEKNYPDLHSLLLLSKVFDVSLDILVKGDLKEMREQILKEDIKKWNTDANIFTLLMISTMVTVVPLTLYVGIIGIIIWLCIVALMMYYAVRIEKQKKKHDIQTYKEIVAFTNGNRLDEIDKIKEAAKKPYQTTLLVILSGVVALIVGIGVYALLVVIGAV